MKVTNSDKDGRLRVEETLFMAAKIVCGEASAHFAPTFLRSYDGRSLSFMLTTNMSNVGGRSRYTTSKGFTFYIILITIKIFIKKYICIQNDAVNRVNLTTCLLSCDDC